MILFDDLTNASSNPNLLEAYVKDNFQEIYDSLNSEQHKVLLESRPKIQSYISLHLKVLRELNTSSTINLAFLSLLLDICERLHLVNQFKQIFQELNKRKFNFGKRLEASVQYIINVYTDEEYLRKYEVVYNNLQYAYLNEEDDNTKVLATITNYYSYAISNFGEFNPLLIERIKDRIRESKKDEASFLNHPFLEKILNLTHANYRELYTEIQDCLDAFLNRTVLRKYTQEHFVLENNTDYSRKLNDCVLNFNEIRQLSVSRYRLVQNNSIFLSLQRGVQILEDEEQLFAYMNSYGKMHHHKLISAFELLPYYFFELKIQIVDWGCGQGMATMSYLNFSASNSINQTIQNCTLIEPSLIALKRAALHIRKYKSDLHIRTVNKDIDSLFEIDLRNDITVPKLHLFSNILDIDKYSISHLLKLILQVYKGLNYFVCVSPYINDIKSSRIDSFVNFFSEMDCFEIIQSHNDMKGEWTNDWTRVLRIFKVVI